jgi:hypothetical protein
MKGKLYDNMFRVVKVNSNELTTGAGINTEIVDLQIPRGFVARVRKIFFDIRMKKEQVPVENGTILESLTSYFMALVNDPDDETSIAIPTHQIDHDVIADAEFHIDRVLTDETTLTGGYAVVNPTKMIDFTEDIDVMCPRNIRFNARADIIGATAKPQAIVTVYFTYERVGESALLELLNIA